MMRKIEIAKDRIEIAKIIEVNLPLMNKNKRIIQDVADCVLAYLTGAIL